MDAWTDKALCEAGSDSQKIFEISSGGTKAPANSKVRRTYKIFVESNCA